MQRVIGKKLPGNNKELYDYWHDKVMLKRLDLIGSANHIQAQTLRHECTNYDELLSANEFSSLHGSYRDTVAAIIKYECTMRVLQRRCGLLDDHSKELTDRLVRTAVSENKLQDLIRKLQEKLFGKDKRIAHQETKIKTLEAQVEYLVAKDGISGIQEELDNTLKKLEQEQKHRTRLAKNNQVLGGRLSWANRWRSQRDEARAELEKQLLVNRDLEKEIQQLKVKIEKNPITMNE